jgi:hypothetical protein
MYLFLVVVLRQIVCCVIEYIGRSFELNSIMLLVRRLGSVRMRWELGCCCSAVVVILISICSEDSRDVGFTLFECRAGATKHMCTK